MLHVVTTGAYYPPVVTTWKILTTGASQLTAGSLCTGAHSDVSFFFHESLVDSKLKRAVEQLRVIACGTGPVKAKSEQLRIHDMSRFVNVGLEST